MKKAIKDVLTILVSIGVAGVILDEAGKGTMGSVVQAGAQKITRGFGV